MYAHDEEGIPDGTLVPPHPGPWDYCFVDLAAPPRVRWPGALEVTIESDCSHWVIYDREPQGICVVAGNAPPAPIPTVPPDELPRSCWSKKLAASLS